MANRRGKIGVSGLRPIMESVERVKENFNKVFLANLNYVGLDAIRHARLNRGYQNRTSNLCNSISYTATVNNFDSETQSIGEVNPESAREDGGDLQGAINKGHSLANQMNIKDGIKGKGGMSLTLVAGMEYARHVEDMGYNVLDSSAKKAEKDFEQAIENIVDDIVKELNGD